MKKVVAVLLAAFATISFVSTPAFADKAIGLDTGNDACTNWDQNDPNYDIICGGGDEGDAQNRVKGILNTVFLWVGIIAVAVMIIGGVLYATSQGEPAKITRAKNAILYAAIGLVIVLLSFAIVNFILGSLK